MRSEHVSDEFYENDEGWYEAKCSCGTTLGIFPDPETACDALMEHAYEAGMNDARKM